MEIYQPANFFLVRCPLLPAETFLQLFPQEVRQPDEAYQHTYGEARRLVSLPLVERALRVASTDIFEGIAYMQENAPTRRRERAYSRVLRYLNRMCMRPTPFGLFAGVAVGTFSDETTLQAGSPLLHHTRTRPDMSWLLALIQQIEEDAELVPCLRVQANQAVFVAGHRAVLPHADVYGIGDARSITLRATPVVCFVLEAAREPLPYVHLARKVQEAFPTASPQQVEQLLRQLWENHFLISDLRPPLTSAQPERYVLDRLRQLEQTAPLAAQLEEVIELAGAVDRAEQPLERLVYKQQQLLPNQKGQAFQLDVALHLERPQLHRQIGEEVTEAVEVLMRLSTASGYSAHLQQYAHAFVERYGLDAEVPVLELLSPEMGLDAPPGYLEPPRSYALPPMERARSEKRDQLLCSLLAETLQKGHDNLHLTDELVQQLTLWEPDGQHLAPPPALELFLQVQAESPEAIDRGEWVGVIAPSGLSYGGRTFCRFFDVLGEYGLNRLRAYTRQEEALFSEDVIFAEMSYLPIFGRGANVAIRPDLRDYEIVLNTTPSARHVLSLQDLVVGVVGERFSLRSRSLGKEVIVTQSHLLNLQRAPNVCRFLLEISEQRMAGPALFDWGMMASAPFLPRVTRGKMILSPARWNLRPAMIELDGDGSEQERFFRGVRRWRELWRVPRYVYLSHFDNRLLLDLEHPLCVAELREELTKAKDGLRLEEMLPDFSHLWLRNAEGQPYVAELVVPVLLRDRALLQRSSEQAAIQQKVYPPRPVSQLERRQLPGEAWTYLKLYTVPGRHDEVIAGPLRTLVAALQEACLIDRWFFLRYADPAPHLRVRFHASSEQHQETVLLSVLDWARELVRRGIISNIVMESYDREIERYGGPEAIDALEQVFTGDSERTSALVVALYNGLLTLDTKLVAVFTLDCLFEQWGYDFAERLAFLQKRTRKYEASDVFRPLRKQFCALLEGEPDAQRDLLCELSLDREGIVRQTASHIRQLAQKGALWMPEPFILESLAHMHINRLLGMDLQQERTLYACWRHALESVQKRRIAKEGKS
uniref:Lantibiotic dehydratase n=1 Tax=Thermosporothrix sp. COM3 TaxID=2490863 RepID=A0A455SGJ6_9CHLR|nr:lantibiotic dehydratase [Thermosporothrix sp. COM3]